MLKKKTKIQKNLFEDEDRYSSMVIDSKVSLRAFTQFLNEQNDSIDNVPDLIIDFVEDHERQTQDPYLYEPEVSLKHCD